MKYQIGDEIIVLHSNEEGKIVEIMNDKMVMIEVRGVKFPAYMDQIDFPYFYRFTKNKIVPDKPKPIKQFIDKLPKEKPQPTQLKVSEGVWLSLLPKFALDDFNDEVVELLKVYLVNKTDTAYQFMYTQLFFAEEEFQLKAEILPFHDFYLHDIAFENINDSPSFHIDFSLLSPNKKKVELYETNLKLKGKQLFKQIEEIKEHNQPTITYKLFDNYPDKAYDDSPMPFSTQLGSLAAKGFKIYDAKKAKQFVDPARSVIDLHIEKLIDSYQHLSNIEILGIQLREFEKWYDLAIANHQANLIVIHGVGKGKLKDEIHDILKTKKEVSYFVNQYDPRFGYGATEIIFKY